MDAPRSMSWSCLLLAAPVAGACAASQFLTGSDLRSAPGLGSACAASASGRVSRHRGLTATACHRKVGSSSVRRTRSLRWCARLSRRVCAKRWTRSALSPAHARTQSRTDMRKHSHITLAHPLRRTHTPHTQTHYTLQTNARAAHTRAHTHTQARESAGFSFRELPTPL